MPLTIRLVDPVTAEQRVYVIRDFEEVTLTDWKRLNTFQSGSMSDSAKLDAAYSVVSEFTGVPESVLDRRTMKEVQVVLEKIGDEVVLGVKGREAFQKAMDSGGKHVPIEKLTIEGQELNVPIVSEAIVDTIPWSDWENKSLPQDESEVVAEGLAAIMSLDTNVGSDSFSDEAISRMMRVRMSEALEVCAVAFVVSERFRMALAHRGRRFPTAINAVVAMAARLAPAQKSLLGKYAMA